MTFSVTLTDPKPGFQDHGTLKSNIPKTVPLREKLTIER